MYIYSYIYIFVNICHTHTQISIYIYTCVYTHIYIHIHAGALLRKFSNTRIENQANKDLLYAINISWANVFQQVAIQICNFHFMNVGSRHTCSLHFNES